MSKSNGRIKIEMVDISELTCDPANTRAHSERNLETIKASLRRFGQQKPVVVDRHNVIIAGNGTLEAARALDWKKIAVAQSDLEGSDRTAYAIADNRTAELAEWDSGALSKSLADLVEDTGIDELVTGFDATEIGNLLTGTGGITQDEPPKPPADPVAKLGDLWIMGDHRVLCGDTTSADDVARLMGGEVAAMLHADPPYGMGKESEGITNDNLHREKLDAFQMAWWTAWRPSVADNGSAYLWGNAPDLWRLWYQGGLADSERLTMRNEIVWYKDDGGFNVGTEAGRMYFPNERCLFFMLGEQGFNNNTDNYWEGWEGIRAALAADCEAMGWGAKDIERICGVGMYGHWFTKSQWVFIPEEHYKKLQDAAREHDAFKREHDAFKREHDELKREFYATRAYFDNTHDNMTDVWQFPRVTGEERHGHATPKPVAMVARAIKSSSQAGDCVGVPFAGTCPEIVACEQLGRKCYGMEIEPAYVDVICQRYINLTNNSPIREGDGAAFAELAPQEAAA